MKPLKLTAREEDKEENLPPSILVNTMTNKYLCTIWADSKVTFNHEFEFTADELEQISGLEKHFFTIYNSILEKDKLIANLEAKNKTLMKELVFSINPINERQ